MLHLTTRLNRLLDFGRFYGLALALASAFLGPWVPNSAQADFFLHSWENQSEKTQTFRLSSEVLYLGTDTNFDADGNKTIVSGLSRYSRWEADFTLAYGWNKYITAFARLAWTRNSIDSLISSQSGDVFGLGDQSLGLVFHLMESKMGRSVTPFSLDLQLQGDFAAYSNNKAVTNNTPFLGDGSTDLSAGLFAALPLSESGSQRWLARAGAGITKRSSDFSSSIPWSARVEVLPFDSGMLFEVGAYGIQSLKNDPNGTVAAAASRSTVGSGGTYLINAINPSLISARGALGYSFNPISQFELAVSQTLWGQDAPQGLLVAVGFTTRWGNGLGKNPVRQSPDEYGKSNRGFVDYNFEAKVSRTNDRLNLLKIDRGSQDGVEVGQIFDIFLTKPDGTVGEAVARAKCVGVKSNEAALEVSEYFKEVWIDVGFIAKRPLQ